MTDEEYRVCSHVIGILAYQLAGRQIPLRRDDLTSEAWRAAVEFTRRWNHRRGPYAPWIYYKIRGALIDYLRRVSGSRYRRYYVRQVEWVDVDRSEGDDPESYLVPAIWDDHPELTHAIDKLDNRLKLVVKRLFWEGAGLKEVAAELGVTSARVCQLKYDALNELWRSIDA